MLRTMGNPDVNTRTYAKWRRNVDIKPYAIFTIINRNTVKTKKLLRISIAPLRQKGHPLGQCSVVWLRRSGRHLLQWQSK